MDCVIYRCSKQDQMYLYLRADLAVDALPEALLKRAGQLTRVMALALDAQRKLARVEVHAVMAQLAERGWFLQMPPDGAMRAHLYFGD